MIVTRSRTRKGQVRVSLPVRVADRVRLWPPIARFLARAEKKRGGRSQEAIVTVDEAEELVSFFEAWVVTQLDDPGGDHKLAYQARQVAERILDAVQAAR